MDIPKLHQVESSNLKEVGYEDGKLYVRFHNDSLYVYDNVPDSIYLELCNASSKGSYFSMAIRNRFPFRKLS